MGNNFSRRNFLVGLGATIAAPAIVKASSLDAIRGRRLLLADETIYVKSRESIVDYLEGIFWNGPNGTVERPFRTIGAALDHVQNKIDINGRRLDVHLGEGRYDLTSQTLAIPERGSLLVDNSNYVQLHNVDFGVRNSDEPLMVIKTGGIVEFTGRMTGTLLPKATLASSGMMFRSVL